MVKNPPAMQERPVRSWVRKIPWRRDRLPTPAFLGFPGGSAGKKSACNAGDLGSIPELGRCPKEGKGYPLQYSGLENSMDCIVHSIAESRTWLSDFHMENFVRALSKKSSKFHQILREYYLPDLWLQARITAVDINIASFAKWLS